MIEGGAVESDGRVLGRGDMVSHPPGSKHSIRTDDGCLLLVTEWQRSG